MKKQYISPITYIVRVDSTHLCTHSITNIEGTQNPIETGGDAGQGTGSDSRRRRRIEWDDEEEEEEYY